MREIPFGEKRSLIQEQLSSAYSHDFLTLEEFERRVEQLNEIENYEELDALVADLPSHLLTTVDTAATRGLSLPEQKLEGSGHAMRRQGNWIKSRNIVVSEKGSTVRLDLDDLRDLQGVELSLELNVVGSSVRIRVPVGTRVIDETTSHGSVVRIRRRVARNSDANGPSLTLTGEVKGSSIRVLPLRRRR